MPPHYSQPAASRCEASTKEQPCRVSIYFPGANKNAKSDVANSWWPLGGAAFAAVIFVLGGKLLYSSWIDSQNAKNNLLKKEIVKLDAQIADIQDLENRKQRLVARMEIIEKLQRKRPEIVHLFDELVKTVPEGIYLTQMKETGKKLEIKGVAQSSTRVSTFMRNIDSSVVDG